MQPPKCDNLTSWFAKYGSGLSPRIHLIRYKHQMFSWSKILNYIPIVCNPLICVVSDFRDTAHQSLIAHWSSARLHAPKNGGAGRRPRLCPPSAQSNSLVPLPQPAQPPAAPPPALAQNARGWVLNIRDVIKIWLMPNCTNSKVTSSPGSKVLWYQCQRSRIQGMKYWSLIV